MTIQGDLREIRLMLLEVDRKLNLLLGLEPNIYSLKDTKAKSSK
jgi:hypothetical protein